MISEWKTLMVINVICLVSESFISLLGRNGWKEQQSREPIPVVFVLKVRIIEDTMYTVHIFQSLTELNSDLRVVNRVVLAGWK